MAENRGNVEESGQVSHYGAITGVDSADFTIATPFNIKNNTTSNITLSVKPAGGGDFVSVIFYPGWNVEIVGIIATNGAIGDTDLMWGY